MLCRLSYLGVEGKPYPTWRPSEQPVRVQTPRTIIAIWYPIGYHESMDPGTTIRSCRHRSGLTLRALAARSHTSHSTLAAYEAGRKVPSAATLARIVEAAGCQLEVRAVRTPGPIGDVTRGQELEEVLALAAMFPTRHEPVLHAPVFARR